MKKMVAALSALAFFASAPAQAQDSDVKEFAGYVGLNSTPIGLLTPMAPTTGNVGFGFNLRASMINGGSYGDDVRAFGGGIDIGAGPGRLGLQALYASQDCQDCDGLFGLGADFDLPLWSSLTDASMNSTKFSIGLRPSFGYGKGTGNNDNFSSMSFAGSLPVSVSMGSTTKFVAFLTPGFGWGKIKENDFLGLGSNFDESGTRPILGGGFGLNLTSGIGLNLGFHRVFARDAETAFGLGFNWHGPAVTTR